MAIPAVGLRSFGGPEVLELVDVPIRERAAGEVMVDVRAAAVNPTDTLMRSGQLHDPALDAPFPLVPGMDFAGLVAQADPTSRWRVGDRVAGVCTPYTYAPMSGAYGSQAICPAESLIALPDDVRFVEGSTLLLNGLTALVALDELGLEEGSVLGVTGAAGAVGGYVVELARQRGLWVVADGEVAGVGSPTGPDATVARGPGVGDRFRAAAGASLDGLVDAALMGRELFGAIRPGGGLVTVRPPDFDPPADKMLLFAIAVKYFTSPEKLEELRRGMAERWLTLRVAEAFPPTRAAHAHTLLERGGVRGRLVLEW